MQFQGLVFLIFFLLKDSSGRYTAPAFILPRIRQDWSGIPNYQNVSDVYWFSQICAPRKDANKSSFEDYNILTGNINICLETLSNFIILAALSDLGQLSLSCVSIAYYQFLTFSYSYCSHILSVLILYRPNPDHPFTISVEGNVGAGSLKSNCESKLLGEVPTILSAVQTEICQTAPIPGRDFP